MNILERYKPFAFQQNAIDKGIAIINKYNGLFVMDETGLGKTITVTTILKNLNIEDKSILVISPNIHKPAWIDIMNEAGINATVSGNRKIPTEIFDYIVIDEVQNIGTQKGKTFRELFKKIHLNSTKVILISATPYNNNISAFIDLCALIPFPLNVSPYYMLHYWGMSAMSQEKEHQKAVRFDAGSFQDINNKVETKYAYQYAIKKLSHIVSLFSIRNTREDIIKNYKNDISLMGSFPVIKEEKISFSLPKDTHLKINETINIIKSTPFAWQNKKAYFLIKNHIEQDSLNGIYRTFLIKRLESSIRAFYISLMNGYEQIKNIDSTDKITIGNEKYNSTEKFINDINKDKKTYEKLLLMWKNETDEKKITAVFNNIDDKTVIFTEYIDTLNLLIEKAKEANISYLAFHGQTNKKEFERIEKEFDANLPEKLQSNTVSLLLCTDVLSEGVNLHRAKKLIHFDNKWNPSKIIQREGRINRILNKAIKNKTIIVSSLEIPYLIDNLLSLEEKIDKKITDASLLLMPDEKYKVIYHNYNLKSNIQYNNKNENFYYVIFTNDCGQIILKKKYVQSVIADHHKILSEAEYEIKKIKCLPKALFLTDGYKGAFTLFNYINAFKKHIDGKYIKTYFTIFCNVMYNKILISIIQDLYDNKAENNPAITFLNALIKNKHENNGEIQFSEITAYE